MTRRAGPSVFVSYRRSDTSHLAGRLYDRLVDRFGAANVFMDVDSIQPGSDYREAIDRAVGGSDVMLVLIGTGWVNATDESGRRRLEKPNDVVVLEMLAAVDRNAKIIPVLVDGARMPEQDELPVTLHPLARRHAVQLDHQTFRSDTESLIAAILTATGHPPSSVPASAVRAIRPPSAPRQAVRQVAGVVRSVVRTIRHPRFEQVPGLLAVLAAALLVAGVPTEGALGLGAPDLSLRAYVLGMAVVAVAAGGFALLPRTRSSIGPGVLLGAATASIWGLGIVLSGLALYRFGVLACRLRSASGSSSSAPRRSWRPSYSISQSARMVVASTSPQQCRPAVGGRHGDQYSRRRSDPGRTGVLLPGGEPGPGPRLRRERRGPLGDRRDDELNRP